MRTKTKENLTQHWYVTNVPYRILPVYANAKSRDNRHYYDWEVIDVRDGEVLEWTPEFVAIHHPAENKVDLDLLGERINKYIASINPNEYCFSQIKHATYQSYHPYYLQDRLGKRIRVEYYEKTFDSELDAVNWMEKELTEIQKTVSLGLDMCKAIRERSKQEGGAE